MSELDRFAPALLGAMVNVTDLVTVIDGTGCLEYVNPFGVQLFGYERADELVGRSLAEVIHPDDFERVLTAMARMLDVDAEIPGRPAILRIRRADGTYLRVEANGATGAVDGVPMDRVVVTARPTTDADLHDHLMHLLTSGAPSEKTFELVPELGFWRQPSLLNAVFVRDDEGVPLGFGSPALVELGGLDDPDSPWPSVADSGTELFVAVDDLDVEARARARERGLTFLRARPVTDALHRAPAIVVMAHDGTSPLPADRSTLEFAWMALDKMTAVLEMALAWRCQAVELRRAAATDPLTGLANRAGFWTSYRRTTAVTAKETVSVLCIDLDRFKPVNDSHGHAVGDALLVEVADRLRHIVRPGDLVARLGGDEFTVVLHDLDEHAVATVADRIVHELGAPFEIVGLPISIGASVGVAAAPADGFDADQLLDAADKALYEAKAGGRSRWVR
jgi:diguanylate cyclase (GGDEF)-like protein/PAS domain S-box-containing protein